MQEKAQVEHRRVSLAGIRMFRDNWFYHHKEMDKHKGEIVEVRYDATDFDSVLVRFRNNQTVKAKLTTVTSLKSKTLEHSDAHLREVIEIYSHALEMIADAEISLDAGIPMKEIAKEALAKAKQVFLLNNQEISKGFGGN